jgi:hypothetical protein
LKKINSENVKSRDCDTENNETETEANGSMQSQKPYNPPKHFKTIKNQNENT